jgi:hypothetical protein
LSSLVNLLYLFNHSFVGPLHVVIRLRTGEQRIRQPIHTNTSGILVKESLGIYAGRRGVSCNEDHVESEILLTTLVMQKPGYILCFLFGRRSVVFHTLPKE